MSYSAGEALILTQVQACASFSSTNTARHNWKLLNRGTARTYAILRQGDFEHEHFGMGGQYRTRWTTLVEVWVRWKDDSGTLTTLESRTAEIISRLNQYRKAADGTGGVVDVMVRGAGEPEEMWREGGDGPSWLRQELIIEWLEEAAETLQE